MHPTDPLERALVRSTCSEAYLDDITAGYVKMLDTSVQVNKLVVHEEWTESSEMAAK
ncbi:unnamed protein product [Arabis nemorensis]|uniref:Uncharacterized protein n=1 Tax=Arabis nemorensis TaxID=586526 RepID=A0A565CP82_9BRAS|nr:unnamed protein product [Arabis nemorensis]